VIVALGLIHEIKLQNKCVKMIKFEVLFLVAMFGKSACRVINCGVNEIDFSYFNIFFVKLSLQSCAVTSNSIIRALLSNKCVNTHCVQKSILDFFPNSL
jgi:hypothetical protein